MSAPDYVGGLEFDGVVLVGVDEGRVPPSAAVATEESRHFLSFSWHNRLYVAITRAKYRLELLYLGERGPSAIIANAIQAGLIERSS